MLNRTSSQMCGRWYLPIFLFRDGLFALMYKASLMVIIITSVKEKIKQKMA